DVTARPKEYSKAPEGGHMSGTGSSGCGGLTVAGRAGGSHAVDFRRRAPQAIGRCQLLCTLRGATSGEREARSHGVATLRASSLTRARAASPSAADPRGRCSFAVSPCLLQGLPRAHHGTCLSAIPRALVVGASSAHESPW